MRRRTTRLIAGVAALLVAGLLATPAAAQAEPEGTVDIDFDVGDYDPERGDWPIVGINLTGDLDDEQPVTVTIVGPGDQVLWTASGTVTAPTTTFAVDRFVAVGDVVSAGVSQPVTEVGGVVVERDVEVVREGAGAGGGGRVALSMILAVLVLALLFRSPLPSATTQRWTR